MNRRERARKWEAAGTLICAVAFAWFCIQWGDPMPMFLSIFAGVGGLIVFLFGRFLD